MKTQRSIENLIVTFPPLTQVRFALYCAIKSCKQNPTEADKNCITLIKQFLKNPNSTIRSQLMEATGPYEDYDPYVIADIAYAACYAALATFSVYPVPNFTPVSVTSFSVYASYAVSAASNSKFKSEFFYNLLKSL